MTSSVCVCVDENYWVFVVKATILNQIGNYEGERVWIESTSSFGTHQNLIKNRQTKKISEVLEMLLLIWKDEDEDEKKIELIHYVRSNDFKGDIVRYAVGTFIATTNE